MDTGKKWIAGLVLGMSLIPLAAVAKDKPSVKADNKADFAALATQVRQEMRAGGRFEFVKGDEHKTVDARLDDMSALFDKFGTVAKMDDPAKLQLFNDQEQVNAILTRRDGEQLVCENVAPVGSHITRKTCETYREIQMRRQDTQKYLLDSQRRAQLVGKDSKPVGGPGG